MISAATKASATARSARLTVRQLSALVAVDSHWRVYGVPPTRMELNAFLGVSVNFKSLFTRGLIEHGGLALTLAGMRELEAQLSGGGVPVVAKRSCGWGDVLPQPREAPCQAAE